MGQIAEVVVIRRISWFVAANIGGSNCRHSLFSLTTANTEFQACLDNNALKVEDFFNKRFDVYSGDLAVLEKRHPVSSIGNLDADGCVELRDTLIELKTHLRKLGWYSEVNRRGFRKILKKLDKKSGADFGEKWGVKIFKKHFASAADIDARLAVVDSYLKELGPETPEQIKSTAASAVSSSSELDEMKRIIGGASISTENLAMTKADGDLAEAASSAIDKPRDSPHLHQLLEKAQEKGQLTTQTLNSLLYRAVSRANLPCIRELVEWLPAFDNDVSHRNVIHRYLLHIGTHHGEKSSTEALKTLLAAMKPDQREALSAPDSHGRTPLHYVCQFGLLEFLKVILTYLKEWDAITATTPLDGLAFQDCEGLTPVHLAVLGGHVRCVKLICDTTPKLSDGALVLAAARQNYAEVVKVLIDHGLTCGFKDREGETPLYVSAKLNLMETLKVLLSHDVSQISVAESSRGWTPLFAAAAEGHTDIAKELMAKPECDLLRRDNDGWRAHETAAFRGHVELCRIIMSKLPLSTDPDEDLDDSLSQTPDKPKVKSVTEIPHPDKTLVLVTLGSTDIRDTRGSVTVDAKPFSDLDTHLTLVVRATNVDQPDGQPTRQYDEIDGGAVELPVEEHTTEPIRFYTSDSSKVQVIFDLVPSRDDAATSARHALARGVASVDSLDPLKQSGRRCLRDVHEVPLIERSSMAIVGSVRFRVLMVTPFSNPNMKVRSQEYWNSLATRVIGHRGLGKNTNPRGRDELQQQLQMGENTLDSFLLASKLGASHVEFDVQLTKDFQPVIYHDFLVSEAGIDVPMHALTEEQFSSLHSPPPKHTDRRKGHRGVPKRSESLDVGRTHRHRAFSVSDGLERVSEGDKVLEFTELEQDDPEADDHITHRMKYTRDYKMKGFKGNSRGISIQAPFTTLREVLQSLPPNVGCNIECKYPMLDEGEAEEMEEFALDLNIWADKVLECVFEYGANREIIFSSFHPDVCLMLNHKQGGVPMIGKTEVNPVGYPTLFLTESGTAPMYDIRASSLQEAIRFCRDWNLLGLVSECSPFVMCPRLIQVVKRAGLVCVSYGVLNNNPVIAKTQIKHGVDAVIVDSVKAVHNGLLEPEAKAIQELPTVEGSPPDESAIE